MDGLADTALVGGERADATEHCLAGIAHLSNEVKDASSYIPTYDQRTYAEAIKALNERLEDVRTTIAPRAKFSFKTGRKNASAVSINDAAELAAQRRLPGYRSDPSTAASSMSVTPNLASSREESAEPESSTMSSDAPSNLLDPKSAAVRRPIVSAGAQVVISNQNGAHIILPSSASRATSPGNLTSLKHCVVDMSLATSEVDHGWQGLTLRNIKESLIVCGDVQGAAHVTGVENSVIAVSCRQLRMHNCKACVIYLMCSSRPIIENSSEIQFARLPGVFVSLQSCLTPVSNSRY